jgi:EpsI family protein
MRWVALLAAALMLGGAALAHMGRPTVFMADRMGQPDLETLFPKQFAGWRVDVSIPPVLPAPDVQQRLDLLYNQVVSRTYVNALGQHIMLSVAYGGDQSDATRAHRPEICYPVQGFEISANTTAVRQVGGGALNVRLLMSHKGARREPITYWVVVGEKIALSGLEQKLAQMRYGLKGLIADGMLVRISSIDDDMAHAHGLQAAFIAELAEAIPAAARPRVFGELPR